MHNETCSLLKPNNHYGQGQILSSKYRFMQESLIIITTSHSSEKSIYIRNSKVDLTLLCNMYCVPKQNRTDYLTYSSDNKHLYQELEGRSHFTL